MEWKFFQLWAKAGCGMYVKESKRQKDKRREQEQMGRRKGLERETKRDRELKRFYTPPCSVVW